MMSISSNLPEPVVPQGPWSLFLDIDGTLLEHAAHPDAVVVSAELRTLLTRLESQLDGALAFITGRSIAAVDHLSSAALGTLITINNKVKQKGGQLRLSDINPQIYEVFLITKLNKLFRIYPTVKDAQDSLQPA